MPENAPLFGGVTSSKRCHYKRVLIMAVFLKCVFFGMFLIIGCFIFKDYGVYTDEGYNQFFGNMNLQYVISVLQNGTTVGQAPLIGSFEFRENAFEGNQTPEALVKILGAEGRISVSVATDSISSLNRLLENQELYKVMRKRPVKTLGFINQLDNGRKLSIFDVKRLNRILIDENYPQASPKWPMVMDMDSHVLTHGPIVEITIAFFQKLFCLTESRDLVLMRRFFCFLLFFIGVYLFYLLCNFYFNSWKTALLGSAFLVFSPRIFANAFYNTMDIPFLVFYVFSIYTALRFFQKKSFFNIFVHAFSCALLILVRPIGLIVPFFTVIFFFIDALRTPSWRIKTSLARDVLCYISILVMLIILGWPLLWPHPVLNFLAVLKEAGHYQMPSWYNCFFFGRNMPCKDVPFYFVPMWIAITTPVPYLFLFLVGIFVSVKAAFQNILFQERRAVIFLIVCFLFPLLLAQGKVYDTGRHLLFVYPVILIFSLRGLLAIWKQVNSIFNGVFRQCAQVLIILVIVLSLWMTGYFMARNHPLQYLYFNRLAGGDMQEIKRKFVLDYWGVSYRQALEAILKKDKSPQITVASIDKSYWIGRNMTILTPQDRGRFKLTDVESAEYIIVNYDWDPQEKSYYLYDSINVEDVPVLNIYKRKN